MADYNPNEMFNLMENSKNERMAAVERLRRSRAKVKIMDALYDLHLTGDHKAVDIARHVHDEIR